MKALVTGGGGFLGGALVVLVEQRREPAALRHQCLVPLQTSAAEAEGLRFEIVRG